MRVVFMGTPGFAVPALRALAERHEVVTVYSRPAREAGRGQRERPTPVATEAVRLGFEVRTPGSLRSPEVQAEFLALNPDVAVVAAYGLLLPQAILDMPMHGCLNIHASLLPRWRGAAPIHRAILAGDAETGISVMQMDAGLDTGAVRLSEATPISPSETTGDLHDRLATLGARMIVDVLDRLDQLPPIPQGPGEVTYADKVQKSEAAIDWTETAVQVDRRIRAFSPSPGAWCLIGPERVKVLRSCLSQGEGIPGQVLGGLRIACGTGAVEITELQRPGRRPVSAAEFLRGIEMPQVLA